MDSDKPRPEAAGVLAELHELAQMIFTDDWLHIAAVGPFKSDSRFQKLLHFH